MPDSTLSSHSGSVFLVIGPTGAGKNSVISCVLSRDSRLRFASSLTTRSMRTGESEGAPYHFVSREEFADLAARGDLVEWEQVGDHYYGTSRKQIEDILADDLDVITDVEILGAHSLLLAFPLLVCTIFIAPPSREELIRRIRSRSPLSDSDFANRLKRAELEMGMVGSFDYMIWNDNLDEAADTLLAVIKAHRTRRNLMLQSLRLGHSLAFRTIMFTLRSSGDLGGAKPLTLPKTRLGPTETYDEAFRRLILMFAVKSPVSFDPRSCRITRQQEKQQQQRFPIPHIEFQSECEVVAEPAVLSEINSALRQWRSDLLVPELKSP